MSILIGKADFFRTLRLNSYENESCAAREFQYCSVQLQFAMFGIFETMKLMKKTMPNAENPVFRADHSADICPEQY